MAYNTLSSYTRIVFPYDASRRFNLRVWWRARLIIAGQRDPNTAGVHRPVSSVPAYRRIFQQSFRCPIGSNQPVIGEKDHLALPEMAGPDRFPSDMPPQHVIRQVLKCILPHQANG